MHDDRGKSGRRSYQSAPISDSRIVYEVNSANSRPIDLLPCPKVSTDHSDEVLALDSDSIGDEFSRSLEHGIDFIPGFNHRG